MLIFIHKTAITFISPMHVNTCTASNTSTVCSIYLNCVHKKYYDLSGKNLHVCVECDSLNVWLFSSWTFSSSLSSYNNNDDDDDFHKIHTTNVIINNDNKSNFEYLMSYDLRPIYSEIKVSLVTMYSVHVPSYQIFGIYILRYLLRLCTTV